MLTQNETQWLIEVIGKMKIDGEEVRLDLDRHFNGGFRSLTGH